MKKLSITFETGQGVSIPCSNISGRESSPEFSSLSSSHPITTKVKMCKKKEKKKKKKGLLDVKKTISLKTLNRNSPPLTASSCNHRWRQYVGVTGHRKWANANTCQSTQGRIGSCLSIECRQLVL